MRGEGASAIDINLERVGRGTTLFAILMWPTVVAIAGRNRIAGLMFLAVAVTAVALLPMNAALLGGLLGAVALFAARLAPRTTLAVLGVIFCLYAGFAPSLSLDVVTLDGFRKHMIELPAAWVHRVGIWTFAAEQSGLYAPRGAGFDAARAIGSEGHVIEELRSQLGYAPAAMPLHPHNALLQIWLELGIAGVIAICLIFVGFLRGVWQLRACPWHCAAGCAGLVAALPPLVLSFGVWQTWWIAALCLSAAMSVGLLAIDRHRDAWDRATTPPTVHCPSSKRMGLLSVFHREDLAHLCLMLSRLALMVQAAVLGGQFFDLFSLFDDGGVASKVGVGWSYVADALVVALVVVVIDEGADLVFEIAG